MRALKGGMPSEISKCWLIVRDVDSDRPRLFEGTLDQLRQELLSYHTDLGDVGFTIYELGAMRKVYFKTEMVIEESK